MDNLIKKLAESESLSPGAVASVLELLDQGATVPFIARYRKEVSGEMDEVLIRRLRDRREKWRELDKRRDAIRRSLSERGILDPRLAQELQSAESLARLEDIYLPYRPKKKTRGSMARERGLEPLADWLWRQGPGNPAAEARGYVDPGAGVPDPEAALDGARDILAERIGENPEIRDAFRKLFRRAGYLRSEVVRKKAGNPEAAKYSDYFFFSEKATSVPSHRILAVFRGANEGFLRWHIAPDQDAAYGLIRKMTVRGDRESSRQVAAAAEDACRRLLLPALETEWKNLLKERADETAIGIFCANLRELLLTPALGPKRVLAVDPGLRTGCKIAVLSAQGELLEHGVIYPLEPRRDEEGSAALLRKLLAKHHVEAIAVGNGTGGRETADFIRRQEYRRAGVPVPVELVNESGASVYSASEAARREFPDHDITVRGTVSIGRRLMDPLAELVKLDPKAIGVGQYQHDVDQKALKQGLSDVVISCVNSVGADANTASPELLSYVSGLSPRNAAALVEHRHSVGPFRSREELKAVAGIGPRTFEQCAGFLRIKGGEEPLDGSAVHPESYPLVEAMAESLGCGVADLLKEPGLRREIKPERFMSDRIGLPTLRDILRELEKPGRDPRREFIPFSFSDDVKEIGDLRVGMQLPGIVTNVTAFGAFVDLGVHQDGLVHISEMAEGFVSDPAAIVKVHQRVTVRVLTVDAGRKRIGLSLRLQTGDAE